MRILNVFTAGMFLVLFILQKNKKQRDMLREMIRNIETESRRHAVRVIEAAGFEISVVLEMEAIYGKG